LIDKYLLEISPGLISLTDKSRRKIREKSIFRISITKISPGLISLTDKSRRKIREKSIFRISITKILTKFFNLHFTV